MPSERSENEAGERCTIHRRSFSISGIDQIGAFLSDLNDFIRSNAVPEQQANRARLVCEELVANAISHGSADHTGGVTCDLCLSEGSIAGTVSYTGPAFDPNALPASGSVEAGRVGGQGLRIVHAVTRRLGFYHDGTMCRLDFEVLAD